MRGDYPCRREEKRSPPDRQLVFSDNAQSLARSRLKELLMTFVRNAFTGLTGAFLVLLPLQFLFAGVGIFGGDFGIHEAFGAGLLHAITILMTIFALIGKRWKFA